MLNVLMLSVVKLSVIMLYFFMLNVLVLSVVMPSVIMLCVFMLSVVMLGVVAPNNDLSQTRPHAKLAGGKLHGAVDIRQHLQPSFIVLVITKELLSNLLLLP